MNTTIRMVQPDEAARLINARNPRIATGKHNVNQWHVAEFVRALKEGSFHATHQGIAINESGELVDGFHRLTAIAQSGIPALMSVTTGVPQSVVHVIDRGQRRGASAVLGVDKRVAEIITFLTSLITGLSRYTDEDLLRVHAVFGDVAQHIITTCPTSAAFYSSAPVKSAATLAHKAGYQNAAKRYAALVLMRPEDDAMVPVMMRSIKDEHDPFSRLIRAWIGFTRNDPIDKIIIRDKDAYMVTIRSVARSFCPNL